MRVVEIYKAGTHIETRKFLSQLFIIQAPSGELHWETGEEAHERVERAKVQKKIGEKSERPGGVYVVWMRYHDIAFVLPDWALTVNDYKCPRGFYVAPELKWRKVALGYQSYHFDFLLEDIEDVDEPPPTLAKGAAGGNEDEVEK